MGSGGPLLLTIISQQSPNMKVLALLLAVVPALNALCLVNSCDSYWKGAQAKLKKDGACAVLFDENCCKSSKDHLVEEGGAGEALRNRKWPQPALKLQGKR